MLFSVIRTECVKLRRAPVWIAFLTLPAISAVMGTFNYLQNQGVLKKEWYSLWTQHTIFSSFLFLPALVGVLAAYQWRLEHREHNWNSLMTCPVPRRTLVLGKLLVTGGMAALTLLFTGLLYYVSGRLAGLRGAPPAQLPRWLALGCCGAVCISTAQLYLSMRIRSFALPVAISLVGGIGGLLIANYGYGLYFPYSLMALGMNSNGSGKLTAGDTLPFLISCALFTLLFALLSLSYLRRSDIRSE